MAKIEVTRQATPAGGRYIARISGVEGEGEGELTFTTIRLGLVSADHTFAPNSMRGMGVAMALVERLVADGRAEGFRVVPVCSYVRAQALRHPEWAGVIEDMDRTMHDAP